MIIHANPYAPDLWGHQMNACDFIQDKPGALLDMEMGTGKSAVAIEHIRRTGARLTLLLAPLSVVEYVWVDQFRQHTRQTVRVVALGRQYPSTTSKVRAAEIEVLTSSSDGLPVVVIGNFEMALSKVFREWAVKVGWDLLVIDESHKVKAHNGSISKFVRTLADKIGKRLLLSGTPMPHSPLDIWAQYRIADKTIYGPSFHRFRDYYAELGKPKGRNVHPRARVVTGFKNQGRFRERFRLIAHSVKLRQVIDLPQVVDIPVRVSLPPEVMTRYMQLERRFRTWLETGEEITVANALTRLLRLQQFTSGFLPADDGSGEHEVHAVKGEALGNVLEGLDGQRVVIFARFLNDLARIRRVAQALDLPMFQYSGQVKELGEWYDEGGILAMQIQTGGLGIDLSMSHHAIYYSVGLSLGDYLQSRARLERSGQTESVQFRHLLVAGSIDERIMDLLDQKREVVQTILRDGLSGPAYRSVIE